MGRLSGAGLQGTSLWHEVGLLTPYLELPAKLGPLFELAVGSATAPREMLRAKGWVMSDALEATRDPWTYQRYIQGSRAEFGVAKQGYVVSRSGWFSERSAAYLASGRPVVVQETGFSDWLRTDGGVVPFTTPGRSSGGSWSKPSRRAPRRAAAPEPDAAILPAVTVPRPGV
jgi:hypothetical protein